jgi:hypothetical protein
MACFSRLLLASLLLGPVLSLRAAEEQKKADDSIMANRKDVEALRTDPLLSPQQKLALPSELDSSTLPTFATSGPALPNSRQKSKEDQKRETKSGGWLVDAMMKKKPEQDSRDSLKADKTDELDLLGHKQDPDDEHPNLAVADVRPSAKDRDQTTGRDRESPSDLKAGAKALNPLTGYMAGWMTPGDFSLLQKPDTPGGSTLRTDLPDLAAQSALGPSGLLADFDRTAAPSSRPGDSSLLPGGGPKENPYAQLLAGGSPGANGSLADSIQHQLADPSLLAPPPPPPALMPPPEPSRASPLVPDNLKRNEDPKYFPQLKRF